MKKTPKILPTYYKSPGTPIFRDTTALPFALGGPIEDEPGTPPSWNRPQLSEERIAALKALHGDSIFASANPNDLLFYDLNKEAIDNATDFSAFLDPSASVSKSFKEAPTTKDIKIRLGKGWALDTKTGAYFKVPEELYKEIVTPKEEPMETIKTLDPALIDRKPLGSLIVPEFPAFPTYQMPGYMKSYNFPTVGRYTPLAAKAVQKATGYDRNFMEGYYDEEGNFIPGELQNAQEQNRAPQFVGASSFKDMLAQREYLKTLQQTRGYGQGGTIHFEPSEYGSDAREHYADGGPIYTYSKRPGSYYQKTEDGWLINNSSTGGKYVPINDPTGERAALLNKYAKPQPGINKIYADPLSRNSETTQAVAAKVTPQTKEQWQTYTAVQQGNQQRRSDIAKALELQGMTPKQAADTVASYGSDWPTLETAKARDIQIMNKTAADIQAGINPSSMQSFTPRAPQPLMDRVQDIAFNPFTAAGYAIRGQEIPEYLQEKADNGTLGYWSNGQFIEGRNALDTAVDVATPIGWAHSANNIIDRATNDKSGDFWTEENAWDALNILPGLGLAKGAKLVQGLDAAKDLSTAANATGLTQAGNAALDFAQRVRVVPKSTAAELAIDAGNLVREPIYAPQRPSLLNPAIAPNNTKTLPSLTSQSYPGIMPKYDITPTTNSVQPSSTSSVLKNINSAIPSSIKVVDEALGKFLQGNKNKAAIEKGNAWLKNWIEHPATQDKIRQSMNTAKANSNDFLDRYQMELIQEQASKFTPITSEYPLSNQIKENLQQYIGKNNEDNVHLGNLGVNYTHHDSATRRDAMNNIRQINAKPSSPVEGSWVSRSIFLPQTRRELTTIHEGSHDWISDEALRLSGQRDASLSVTDPEIKQNFLVWENLRNMGKTDSEIGKILGNSQADQSYYANPTEMHARIMELRKYFNLRPGQEIDAQRSQKMINKLESLPRHKAPISVNPFLKVINKNPQNLSYLFNEFWGLAPAAVIGSEMLSEDDKSKTAKKNLARGGFLHKYPFGGDLAGEPVTPVQPTIPPDTNPANPTAVNAAGVQDFYTNWYSKRTLPFAEIGNKQYEKVMRSVLPAYNPQSPLLNDITQKAVPYEVQPMIEGDPTATGALVYNKQGMPEKIQLKESILSNPRELDSTLVHEEHTRIMNPYADKVLPAEQMIINPSIKTFEEGWGNLKGDAADAAGEYYDYITDPQGGNIQSMLFEVRKSKNLQPDQVITDQDIESWKQEAEQSGALDPNNANYDNALYNLFKLGKDNASIKNLFNYIASNKTQQPNAMSGSMNNMG